MDEDQDRMYVGCKDHALSMDINNITHSTLKVSRCFLMISVNSQTTWFSLTMPERRKIKRKISCTTDPKLLHFYYCNLCNLMQIGIRLPPSEQFWGYSKEAQNVQSSRITDLACWEGAICRLIDRHETHKQMGKHLCSPRECYIASIKLLDIFIELHL